MPMQTIRTLFVFFSALGALRADMVFLSNGDRVSGQVISADAKTVVIKTPYAGELKIERSAVADIRVEAPMYVTLAEGAVIVSKVEPGEKAVRLIQPDGLVKTVSRTEITALRNEAAQKAYEREEERWKHPRFNDFWRGSMTFSVANTSGNAKTTTLSTAANAVREAGKNVLALNFSQIYATQSTTEPFGATANRISGSVRADRRANGRLFLYGINAYDYDRFLALDLRSVFGGGLGYKPWASRRGALELSGGANWNREKFSRQEGPLVRNSGEAAAGQELTLQLLSRLKLFERAGFFPNLTNRGEYRLNFDANAAVPVMKWLEWTVGLNDRYLSNPLPGKKKNDLAITMGVRVSFDQTRR
jgi:putative salt-induced outer membrane protein